MLLLMGHPEAATDKDTHRSLRVRKLEGQRDPESRDLWYARVTDAYRFTFAIDTDTQTYILYRVGLTISSAVRTARIHLITAEIPKR